MGALSDTTVALIEEVHRLVNERTWPWKQATLVEQIVAALASIGEAGEWLAIPRIISLVLDPRKQIAEAAASSVQQLRGCLPILDLSLVDRGFRELSPYTYPDYMRWRSMGARDLRQVVALDKGAAALQFAMCHPIGYVREEAIRLCAACADGAEIPFLLLRSNDWVTPVRELARSALRARLRPENLPDLIDALPMLERMRKWGRLGDRSLLGEIDTLLAGPDGTPMLVACKSSDDRFVRRAAFRRLAVSSEVTLREALASALSDDDSAIRSWAGRLLCDAEAELFLRFADMLLSNRLGAIRFAAAQRLVELERPLPWQGLLFDLHAGVRALAQQVALSEDTDPEELYRRAIPTSYGARLCVALFGLSETGGPDVMVLVRAYLPNDAPRVRRSALHALAKLKADDLVDLCLCALSDASPGVAHTARLLLKAGSGYVAPARVWEAFEGSDHPWGKKDALALLSSLEYWMRLPYLLRAFRVEEPEVKERASLYLSQWLGRRNRVFTSPSAEIDAEVRGLLTAPEFSERFRAEVCAVLADRAGSATHAGRK